MSLPGRSELEDEGQRRLRLAEQLIRQAIGLMVGLTALFLVLRINILAVLLAASGALFALCLVALRRGHVLYAKLGLVLSQNGALLGLALLCGYECRIHYPLISQLPLSFMLFGVTERRAMRFAALLPLCLFALVELLQLRCGLPGVLPPPVQRSVWLVATFGMLAELALRGKLLYDSNHRSEDRLQAALQEALRARAEAVEASRVKSGFLANMSHEIRTPMNGILGMNHLLLQTAMSGEQREYAVGIESSAKGLLGIINDILDLSKIEAGKLQLEEVPFSLSQVLEEVLAMVRPEAQRKGLSLAVQLPEGLHLSRLGDPLRLRQVLLNLLGNALKFTDAGAVTLSVTETAAPERLRLAVTDTGIGIPKDRLPHIFDAFTQADSTTTRRFGGTGLGLTISRELAAAMGGALAVESEPGRGSTFSFTARLPRCDPALLPPRAAEAAAPEAARSLRVLLAEDNAINATIATRLLQRLGHSVVHVENGALAADAARSGAFDVVLMDVQMPEMDGLEAARRIREEEAARGVGRLPIIALTANAMKGDDEQCLAAGMDGYLAKPLDPARLKEALGAPR